MNDLIQDDPRPCDGINIRYLFDGETDPVLTEKRLNRIISNLKQAKQKAEQANLAKSQFIAAVSHDLRTPLNAVLGFADLLHDTEATAERRELLTFIKQAGGNLMALIEDIVDLSRIEAGKKNVVLEKVEIRAHIDAVLRLFLISVREKNLGLEVVVDKDVPDFIYADGRLLRQVLVNLIGNAVKFTSQGAVTVGLQAVHQPPAEAHLIFHVSDTGPGIAPEHRHRIFSLYERIDPVLKSGPEASHGAGLGLAICKNLVSLMGGEILLTTAPQGGARFSFTIPLLPCSQGTRWNEKYYALDAAPEGQAEARPALVLAVDDDRPSQILLEYALSSKNLVIKCADNGVEAMQMLEIEKFDVILTDIIMPLLNGVDLTQKIRSGQIRNCSATLPVIAVTARAMAGDREFLLQKGLTDYISKPIDLDLLGATIKHYVTPDRARISPAPAAE